ncbi:MAG: sugar phosphate isomerase/epimerase [Acidobacteria bacterium]|nr:sugar phosphate isomerase/epimerase [Acidobacteriota bacterium]MBV9435138.1 sugar phosphate isomerase/epimerase [Acidobacteriota bacterium]
MTRRGFLWAVILAPLLARAFERKSGIKVGVCTRDFAGAAQYGFDYIEPSAADIAAMSADDFRQFSSALLASPLRCEAFNGLIRRPDLKVVGNEVSTSALREYLNSCLERCRTLGASVVVWGSAGSRNVPEGFPRDRAQQQIADFLHLAGDIAAAHDLVVAIEPLRHQESNILNTGAEALEMVRRVNHPKVRMIIDYYHMREENEEPSILETAKREIVHLHFANPHGRLWPHDLAEDDHYAAFFAALKKSGFSGGISVEGKGKFETDGAAARSFFNQALA